MNLSELLTDLGLTEAQTKLVLDSVKKADETLLSKPLDVIVLAEPPRSPRTDEVSPTTLPEVMHKLRLPAGHQAAIIDALFNDLISTADDALNPSSYMYKMCGDAIRSAKIDLSKTASVSKSSQTPPCTCQPCKRYLRPQLLTRSDCSHSQH